MISQFVFITYDRMELEAQTAQKLDVRFITKQKAVNPSRLST